MMRFLILLTVSVSLSGCFLIPFIDTFQKSGITESSRKELLPKKVKSFYSNVVAGRFFDMAEYLHPDRKDTLLNAMRKNRKIEKVTAYEVDYLEFFEGANTAEVHLLVSYYHTPYYVVQQRLEKQIWKFYGSRSSWRLYQRVIDENS